MAKKAKECSLQNSDTPERVTKKRKPLGQQIEKTRVRRKSYTMDLRIHSPSSLGYLGIDGLDTAPALVRLAKVKKIDVIAVTDFYDGRFIDRVMEAAVDSRVTVLPGVVIRCSVGGCNDVVLTCLFPEESDSNHIHKFLHSLSVPGSAMQSSSFIVPHDLKTILEVLERFEGTAFPSRMDQTPYRKVALSTLIEEFGFRAFDLAYYPDSASYFKQRWPDIEFQLFSFSNANSLAQIGSRISKIKMSQPGFKGIKSLIDREQVIL